ncbi:MAG: ferrous iron transporter B, partial [Clostridiales bacterium]|nr:ferrous iron transporter B [Clostridiales bacterium]
MASLRFALAGNPNSGKTTLFNALTGSTAHVGNWPGVTVDKKEGLYKKGETPVEIIDLPGIYSLSPYTPEEVIARNYILDEKPDCIINIVDATNLERNLYLTTQLLEIDVPVIIALNMTDVLEKRGDDIDEKTLEQRIGVPVVEISALKGMNVDLLMERGLEAVKKQRKGESVIEHYSLWHVVQNAKIALELKGVHSPVFHAVKLVEKDEIEVANHPNEAKAVDEFLSLHDNGNVDAEAEIADARYKYIEANFSTTLKRSKGYEQHAMSRSDKVDKVMTHKWAGIPIFLVILFAVFHLTFSENFLYLGSIIPAFGEWCGAESESVWKGVFFAGGLNSPGVILFNLLDLGTGALGDLIVTALENANASEWAIGLIVEGVLGGVFGVLSFLPQILVLFLLFSIL